MKQTISIVSFLFLFCMNALSQDSIVYDFSMPKKDVVSPPSSINISKSVTFRIKNVNLFLYDVEIKSKQVTMSPTPPAALSLIGISAPTANTGESLKKEEKAILDSHGSSEDKTAANNSMHLVKRIEAKADEISFLELKLEKQNSNLEELKQKGNLNEPKLKAQLDSLKNINDALNSKIKKLNRDIDSLRNVNKTLNEKIQDAYLAKLTELLSVTAPYNNAFEKLEETKVFYFKLFEISQMDRRFDEIQDKIKDLEKTYTYSMGFPGLIVKLEDSYSNFKQKYQEFLASEEVKKQFSKSKRDVELVNEVAERIEQIHSKVSQFDYSSLIQKIDNLYDALHNLSNFNVVSDPVQPTGTGDIINFDIKITPKRDIQTVSSLDNKKFTYSIPVKGGWMIDFSSGLIFSFGLNDKQYKTEKIPTDTSKIIIRENPNRNSVRPFLAALVHFTPRTIGNCKFGASLGISTNSIDFENSNILTGISCIVGKKEKWILSGGIAISKIAYLKSSYELDKPIDKPRIPDNDLVEKVCRTGFFIGITYNFTNAPKE